MKNTVEKCNLCYQRISEGDLPARVEGCPTLAMTFGDLNDPESDISKLVAELRVRAAARGFRHRSVHVLPEVS